MINEKAEDLGKHIGKSPEYQALRRARESLEQAGAFNTKFNRLQELSETIQRSLLERKEPAKTDADEYDRLLGEVQGDDRYQQLVAAQSNFDKLMLRVNEQISEGMRKGAESPIITLS